MKMKTAGWLLGCGLLMGLRLFAAPPEEADNPYAVISERNVFHLSPAPPPPEPDKPKLELPTIKLSGFFRVGSRTRALFSSYPKKKEEGTTYYNLAQGEKDGILEVVKIDEENGSVDILTTGNPATLTLKDDVLPSAATPAARPPDLGPRGGAEERPGPPMPGMPSRRSFAPGGRPGGLPGMPGANGSPYPNPMRPRRTPAPVGE
jgi:hypothetical protein